MFSQYEGARVAPLSVRIAALAPPPPPPPSALRSLASSLTTYTPPAGSLQPAGAIIAALFSYEVLELAAGHLLRGLVAAPLSAIDALLRVRGPGMEHGDAVLAAQVDLAPDGADGADAAQPPSADAVADVDVSAFLLKSQTTAAATARELAQTHGLWSTVMWATFRRLASALLANGIEPLCPGIGIIDAERMAFIIASMVTAPLHTAIVRFTCDVPSAHGGRTKTKYTGVFDALTTAYAETGLLSYFKHVAVDVAAQVLDEWITPPVSAACASHFAAIASPTARYVVPSMVEYAIVGTLLRPLYVLSSRLAVDGEQPVELKGLASSSTRYSVNPVTAIPAVWSDTIAADGVAGLFHGFELGMVRLASLPLIFVVRVLYLNPALAAVTTAVAARLHRQ